MAFVVLIFCLCLNYGGRFWIFTPDIQSFSDRIQEAVS